MPNPTQCPNCGIAIRPGTKHCKSCGARNLDEPRKPPPPQSSGWGDLDLDRRPSGPLSGQTSSGAPRQPAQQANTAVRPTMSAEPGAEAPSRPQMPGGDLFGGRILDDQLVGDPLDGPALELEVEKPKRRPRKTSREVRKQPEQSPEQIAARKKQEQIRQIGGYGEKPAKPIGYPLYALRVLWRQYRLNTEVKERQSGKQQPNQEMNRALKSAGQAMNKRPELAGREPFAEKIRAIGAADRTRDELKAGRNQTRASRIEQMKQTARDIQQNQQKVEPLRGEETRLLEELRQRRGVLEEIQANDRRAEEEHHALVKNAIGEPDPGWQAQVDNERKQRQSEIAAAQSEVDESNRQLQTVRRKLTEIGSEVDALNQKRKTFAETRARDEQEFESRTREVQKSREAALVELGRLGMEQKLENVADRDFEAARRALSTIEEIDREIELRRKALPTYEKRPFRTGLALLAVGLALLIALYAGLSALLHEEEPYEFEYLESEGTNKASTRLSTLYPAGPSSPRQRSCLDRAPGRAVR